MRRFSQHLLGGACLAVLVLAGIVLNGRAASALTLVPPSLEFGATAGETLRTSIKLYNEGLETVNLFTSTANFSAQDEQGTPNFDFDHPNQGLAGWITTDPTQLTLAAGERREVAVTVNVPSTAEPGGHYAAVFFGTQPPATKGGQVGVVSKVGTLVILRIEGTINEAASVKEFSIVGGKKSFVHPPVSFRLRIQNTGNVHVRPSGTIEIKNMFGGQTASLVVNPSGGAVLPDSIRQFQVDWKKDAGDPQGFFNHLKTEWRHFGLGAYTAQATITYGSSPRTLIASTSYTLFPWHLLLVELAAAILVVWLLTFGVKRYNDMIVRRAQNKSGPRLDT